MKTEIEIRKMLRETEEILRNIENIPEGMRAKFSEITFITIEVLKEVLEDGK